jgi:hypothetical protein
MKKLAANYVLSESGDLLKNGILIAEDDGSVLEYTDTQGNLQEMAQLTFHNGILMANFSFVRVHESLPLFEHDERFMSTFLPDLASKGEVSILGWLEICKMFSASYSDLIISQVFREVTSTICGDGGFRKENVPGVYLLTGSDLLVLKLSKNVRLKRIL